VCFVSRIQKPEGLCGVQRDTQRDTGGTPEKSVSRLGLLKLSG
jgi:hypothetical protein